MHVIKIALAVALYFLYRKNKPDEFSSEIEMTENPVSTGCPYNPL